MTVKTGYDNSLVDLFRRLKMRLKCERLYCLELRLKSDFQHWPSDVVSNAGFFTEIRGTEAFPTHRALFGMCGCALGYSDEHEDKKKELEEKIVFGDPIRTPYLYHADYTPGEIRHGKVWTNDFLKMRYVKNGVSLSGPRENPEISDPENRRYLFREMRGVLIREDGESEQSPGENRQEGAIEIYISYDFCHDVYEAADISDRYAFLKNAECCQEEIESLSFTTLKNDTVSVSFHAFRDSRLAIVICTEFNSEEARKSLLDGFMVYRNLDEKRRAPYKRFYDFVTANRLFEWQKFQTGNGKGKDESPAMTKCVYLTDADFVVKAYGDYDTLKRVADALDRPAFIYYFGKKTCRPTRRVNQGITEV